MAPHSCKGVPKIGKPVTAFHRSAFVSGTADSSEKDSCTRGCAMLSVGIATDGLYNGLHQPVLPSSQLLGIDVPA